MPRNLPLRRPIDRREPYPPYLVVTGDQFVQQADPVGPSGNAPLRQPALARMMRARSAPAPGAPSLAAPPRAVLPGLAEPDEVVRIMDGVGGMFGSSTGDPSPWTGGLRTPGGCRPR
ncbi:hypothetical protein OHV05_06410 [Kitasatospora sp. NBC_00070]|uniref:hypothetical protein n=1 Tax=Kitasatospora sp. NBC_00070 TaxID=2975962 RepID=UPI00324B2E1A